MLRMKKIDSFVREGLPRGSAADGHVAIPTGGFDLSVEFNAVFLQKRYQSAAEYFFKRQLSGRH
jgi:hypothetical protein